jgi:hypothetical protein
VRLAKAVADAKLTQAQADTVLARFGKLADRLTTTAFPSS